MTPLHDSVVTLPPAARYERSYDTTGNPVVTFYTSADEPALQLRVDDADAAAALAQGARALANEMGVWT